MCYVTLIAMGVSAALAAANAASAAAAQNRQAGYNEQVAKNNADISRQEGRYAEAQGMRNANEKRKETNVLIGAQRARQGASGVVVGSGSTLDVTMNTAGQGEREAMALLQQSSVETWRSENRARGHEQEARHARNSRVSVTAAVAGSVLSSAASAASSFPLEGIGAGSTTFPAPSPGTRLRLSR